MIKATHSSLTLHMSLAGRLERFECAKPNQNCPGRFNTNRGAGAFSAYDSAHPGRDSVGTKGVGPAL
jgi:hypothetical protein